ncbi:hypothetical protein CCACVL1_16445 [Corchorus capsularis]|uniref:Uncharacterized protein n=1 Tax=Corchorus capsularis TaxID=210143 RepID=A0A1R3HX51_COCAP|nr:hypothetical protein CCACVL1_16445 [Corchorus capsularis]
MSSTAIGQDSGYIHIELQVFVAIRCRSSPVRPSFFKLERG